MRCGSWVPSISATSGQDGFVLKDTVGHERNYQMKYEGGQDYLMFSQDLLAFADLKQLIELNKDLVWSEEMTKSMVAQVTSAPTLLPGETDEKVLEGIYRDTITFKCERIPVEEQYVQQILQN